MAKLIKKIKYNGVITTISGLHIGGTNSQLNIGGPDKFVVRNPIDKKPYIPGSSLKGKMRSLIELADGTIDINERRNTTGPCKDPKTNAGALFGTSGDSDGRPSRIIVRDAILLNAEDLKDTDLLYTESKTEVSIDRVTSKANPRTNERIPAGAKFKFQVIINIFDNDNEEQLKKTFKRAIKLLEDDYLGGNGSRGYGQITIELDNSEGEIVSTNKL